VVDPTGQGRRIDLPGTQARVLGRLLAAQNVLPVLPTSARVAEFYAGALASIPGVVATRVCLGHASSQAGAERSQDTCARCAREHVRTRADATMPVGLRCALSHPPDVRVIPLQTTNACYGFFVVHVADSDVYEVYAPFVANIGSFLALWLENGVQQDNLRRGRDALERTVAERTQELSSANARLEAEIEERRRVESTVRELNRDLELRVRDRTRQLEAANNELEAFAYSVSHDLRAPLRHISAFAGMLQESAGEDIDEPQRHYLEAIGTSAAHLLQLIDDLLSFSRMARAELSCQPVDLATLVRGVIRELEPEAGERTVRWNVTRLPVVQGDPAMLRIVLMNLIANALKFTRPRPVTEIDIGCADDTGGGGADGGDQVVIFVSDNGIGFDMACADQLFGVFERLAQSAATFEGTGIGLATVRRIVQRHGGRTWATGADEQGATFFFSLPLNAVHDGQK
jgi:signal transduction histidine kinase